MMDSKRKAPVQVVYSHAERASGAWVGCEVASGRVGRGGSIKRYISCRDEWRGSSLGVRRSPPIVDVSQDELMSINAEEVEVKATTQPKPRPRRNERKE